MAFTARDVQALRERTGCGMMDCKKALVESDGNIDAAIEILRKKGLAAAEKKAGRIAAEGVVLAVVDEAKKAGALVEINAETDFVAKNEMFIDFVNGVAATVLETNPANVEELMGKKLSGSDVTVEAALQEKILTIGENIKIRRFVRIEGELVSYIHGGGRIGVMVRFDTEAAPAVYAEAGKDVAMQIAALNPLFLDSGSVPAETLEYEKNVLREQVIAEGKPEAIADKIVMGKIAKYFKDNCLVSQEFVKDSDLTVGEYLEKVSKEAGAEIKAAEFIRWERGEGLEKRQDNFADEVAGMMGQ